MFPNLKAVYASKMGPKSLLETNVEFAGFYHQLIGIVYLVLKYSRSDITTLGLSNRL